MAQPEIEDTTLIELVTATPPGDLEAVLRARTGGVDGALDAVFDGMAGRIDRAKVRGDRVVVQFEVALAGGVRPYVMELSKDEAVTARGRADDAGVTIGLALADLFAMAAGELDGQRAFLAGKLSVRGNPLLGMKLGKWLQR